MGGHRIGKSPLYGESTWETYREYTGAYRAIDGACDAGPFRPIGVIMPISLSIPAASTSVPLRVTSYLFFLYFCFLFLFCIPAITAENDACFYGGQGMLKLHELKGK